MTTHQNAASILLEVFARAKAQAALTSGAPLRYPILRRVPAVAQEEIRRLPSNMLSLQRTHAERYAREVTQLEGRLRLTLIDYHVRDVPCPYELYPTDMCAGIAHGLLHGAGVHTRNWTPELRGQALHQELVQTWVDSQLRLRSEPVFVRPSPGLAHRLFLTDTRKVCGAQIRFPFPAFNVFLPPGLVYGALPGSGACEITHLTLAESVVTPAFAAELGMPLERAERFLIICGYGREDPRTYTGAEGLHVIIPLTLPNDDEPQMFRDDLEIRIGTATTASAKPLGAFALNLLLYLASAPVELKQENAALIEKLASRVQRTKHPRQTDLARLAKERAHTIYDVGTSILVDPALETALRNGTTPRDQWSLTYKTLVRGHWRNQACGTGRQERKMIWIEPHTRGPDFADKIATHTYDVR